MRMIGIGTTLAAFLVAAPAAAVEPEAFLERVQAAYGLMGYDFTFGPARAEGDAIVVDGMSASIVQAEGMLGPVDLDVELRFTGVSETEDGTYRAEALTIDRLVFEADAGAQPLAVTVEGLRMTDFYLPPQVGAEVTVMLFSDLETGPLSFTHDGVEVLSVAAIRADSTFNPPPGEGELVDVTSHLLFEGMTIRTGPGKSDAKAGYAILGASDVTGAVEATIDWSMENGRVSLAPLRIAFDGQGALELAFAFDGMTPEVLQMIYETDRQMAEFASKGKSQSAAELQMRVGFELLEKLHLVSAHVRYDDAGLAPRFFAYAAQHEGQEPNAYVEGLIERIELNLANARAPALAQSIVGQVRRFLADPQSLEVAVAPASPLKLITAVSAAVNPAGLANMLKLSVTAEGEDGDDNNESGT
ncbi:hypothetical protein VE25_20165 [Devosia geojensis]|uniref:Uncharacterized protein n=1 Tax=Devosia geojensis TaxID=443610 RepID=A0A0F5FDT9_9HYPH|nr:hypothetical protein [Devosia geojensis]KKB06968.1 hypothetical protein VE25_20165 [Devosia geojensis]